ncbi:DUF302 domain-containing protein [Thermococcus sp. M39]|uniref:DUF302 domain-containing protein n=1 Tax=unclassified Thermococcus TaxID=2627626 RepID=UPI00143A5268|nr:MULTISPECIES: DUF302 domain-containing protein [unclassified Thermococcus]NJE09010.1 DUF302 domain-containing protein [Thermococcus sp. M39]NJE13325.1 DUF302 domain-containing protein [Thermococcus sp. LS2]
MYKYVRETSLSFEEAEARFKEALEKVGLKAINEIPISNILKNKLNVEIPAYKTFLICNPKIVNELLALEYDIGLLVPCHGVVYEKEGKVYVGVELPSETLKVAGEQVSTFMTEIEENLKKAVDMVVQ